MKLVDRLLVAETSGSFCFGLAIFSALLVTGDLLSQAIKLIVDSGAPVYLVIEALGLRLPSIVVLTIPMAILLATLLSFNRLSAQQEITAMRAGGISFVRIMVPIFFLGLFASLLSLLLQEQIAPQANRASDAILVTIGGKSLSRGTRGILLRDPPSGDLKRIIFAVGYSGDRKTFERPDVLEYNQGRPVALVSADSAVWEGGSWKFTNGYFQTIGRPAGIVVDHFSEISRQLGKSPDEVEREIQALKPENMTRRELREFLSSMQKSEKFEGFDRKYRQGLVEMHNKLAVPFSCLVFALVGAPLGMQPQRSSSSIGIGLSIMCIFLYYVIWYYSSLLGYAGRFPPMLASWSGNIVTAIVGIGLVARASK